MGEFPSNSDSEMFTLRMLSLQIERSLRARMRPRVRKARRPETPAGCQEYQARRESVVHFPSDLSRSARPCVVTLEGSGG